MHDVAQLSSIASGLSELTDRLTAIAEGMAGTGRDDAASVLFEVERSLQAAGRRLEEVVRTTT